MDALLLPALLRQGRCQDALPFLPSPLANYRPLPPLPLKHMLEPDLQVETALAVLQSAGVEVRKESLGGSGGGLCQLKGKRVFFLDLDADSATRAERCIAALSSLSEIEGVFLPPALRELVDRHRLDRLA